jgi:hypothetical protein
MLPECRAHEHCCFLLPPLHAAITASATAAAGCGSCWWLASGAGHRAPTADEGRHASRHELPGSLDKPPLITVQRSASSRTVGCIFNVWFIYSFHKLCWSMCHVSVTNLFWLAISEHFSCRFISLFIINLIWYDISSYITLLYSSLHMRSCHCCTCPNNIGCIFNTWFIYFSHKLCWSMWVTYF